ncbi:MAG TPA: hypothetical protein VK191_12100 [Symbiobacteriaceae bacterium]|nr:hypothetical protein [Symbiobacteriaceae bacterium]
MPVIINEVTVVADPPAGAGGQHRPNPAPAPTGFDLREIMRQQAERLARVTPE